VRDSDRASRAALHAQTLIDQLGVGVPLEPGQRNGELEDGRYRWEMEIQRYDDPLAQAKPPGDLIGAPVLMQVRLDMRWGEGRPRERLRVDTLRLTVPSALPPGPQL
jgi:general secretion pathway protein I